jgi:flavodoxin/ferredoxin
MRSIVIYFSQSGNTKKMARSVAEGISSLVDECNLVRIDKVRLGDLPGYDLIGIGTPVWAGVPPHVEKLIKSFPTMSGQHAFSFCTHGTMPARFFPAMANLLVQKGLVNLACRGWYCSCDFPFIPKPYLTDGHPDEIDLEEAKEFGREMVDVSVRLSGGETDLVPPTPPLPPPRANIPPPVPMRIDLEKCRYPECTLCIDHCRMKIINLSVTPPVYPRKGCQTCYYCEYICPTGAVELDYSARTAFEMKAARGPFIEALATAEKEGRFRRLVRLEDVGWDTPYHEYNNRHPRYPTLEDDDFQ